MRDYNGATIVKIIDDNENRLAGLIKQAGFPDERYDTAGLMKLSAYLRTTGQQLKNAAITSDGRIVPFTGCRVRAVKNKSIVNACIPTKDSEVEREAHHRSIDTGRVLNDFDLPRNKTNARLSSIILDGIVLLSDAGVKCELIDISTTSVAGNDKNAGYLTASVIIKDLHPYYRSEVGFNAYFDGTVDVVATKTGGILDNDMSSLFDDDDSKILCNSAVDVRNAVYSLLHKNKKSNGYDKHKREIDLLVKESAISRKRRGCKEHVGLVLPHIPITDTFQTEIRSLTQIEQALRERFIGSYTFIWDVKEDRVAVFSVYKHITKGSDELSDKLLDLRLEMESRQYDPYSGYSKYVRNAVKMSHMTVPTAVTQGGGRWVRMDEFQDIRWLDELGYATKAILDSIFNSGVLRESLDVIAISRDEQGKAQYMVKGRKDLLSAYDLLQAVKNGKIVNGICFEVGHYGDLAITHTGLDRNRRKMPVLVQNSKGGNYIHITYEFVDILSDDMVSISTAVGLESYQKLAFSERRVTGGLQNPKEYIEPMLMLPKSQIAALTHIGTTLYNEAVARGYTSAVARTVFLMNFMRCCRFIGLADTVSGNRTPTETLVERAGCCIEKSVLAAALAHHVGLTPSVIMRYSPALQTRFHAVLGVQMPEQIEATPNNTAEDYCRKHEGELWYVHVGGYIGVELTKNVKHFIGSVCSWGDNCTDAVTKGQEDTSRSGQVIIIPINAALACEAPIMQSNDKKTVVLNDAHWQKISEWAWD